MLCLSCDRLLQSKMNPHFLCRTINPGGRKQDETSLHSPTMTVVKLCDGSKEHLALPSSGRPVREKSARFCGRSGETEHAGGLQAARGRRLMRDGTLTYQIVALRLKGVRSANIQPLAVHGLEHPDVVETVPLQGDGRRGCVRLQTESEAACRTRPCIYLFWFPFLGALVHVILRSCPLNLKK